VEGALELPRDSESSEERLAAVPPLAERLAHETRALRHFVRALLRGSAADVDDVVQDVLARAWQYRATFDGGRALGPWLRASAVRAVVDHRVRAARRPVTPVAADDEPTAQPHGDALAEREDVDRLLARLDAHERDVLVRFHQRGESIAEIARSLALPAGTVKSLLHRARRRLAHDTPRTEEDS
jgi:RNA polymerase sigma-70 factor (ECF subfamily)